MLPHPAAAMRQADAEPGPVPQPRRPPRRIIETSGDANARTATFRTETTLRLALLEPDIPQNVGTILRLGACMGVPVDVIEPCGFILEDRRLRRAGMDYIALCNMTRHRSWDDFRRSARSHGGRLLLLTTAAMDDVHDFSFMPSDTLLFGRESAGAPAAVHEAADARLRIPMAAGARSLNVALAAAMVLGEALRQTGALPKDP